MRNFICSFFIIAGLLLNTTITYAANLSVTDSKSCTKLANTQQPFILVLKQGENVLPSIINCAKDAKLASASLSGLGSIENPRLAYYNMKSGQYHYKLFSGIYEIASLEGNITQTDNLPSAHVHVALSDEHYHVIGGHLSEALVGNTLELTIIPLKSVIIRKTDPNFNLRLINP